MQADPSGGPGPRYAAGWYPDPAGQFELRYHNGTAWTGDVSTGGNRYVSPLLSAGDAPLRTRNGIAVGAMVLGISALAVAWMPWLFVAGAVCGVVAIVLGVVGRRRAQAGAGRRGMATSGVVLGALALPVAVVGFLLTRIFLSLLSPGDHTVSDVSCQSSAGRATYTGEITNLEDDERGYLVVIRFLREGTSSSLGQVTTQVDPVAGGATGSFTAGLTTDVAAVDCEVVDVYGEFPLSAD